MRAWIWIAVVFVVASVTFTTQGQGIDSLVQELNELRLTVSNLARQTMSQQMFVEERIRSDGSSGIKQTRTNGYGNTNYHMTTHTSSGVAAIHDHPDNRWTVGMGEMVVVLNGVEFRTRHNDYSMVKASSYDRSFHAVEHVESPDVPPEVLAKRSVTEQAEEMRKWFKAFQDQDYSVRDYRKYFRPALCYLEGAWTLDENLEEPFESERHNLVAESWEELQQQIRYTSFTGTKDPRENFAYLPTTIMNVDWQTGKPVYGQWNYRILCHQYSGDIPTKFFRLQDDMATRAKTKKTLSKLYSSRAARFRLSRTPFYRMLEDMGLLDDIMYEIPGKDNRPEMLGEDAFHLNVYDPRYSNLTRLNTGYYHRFFRTSKRGAMGLERIYRGFSDEHLFFAETTQPRVASEHYKHCMKKRQCSTQSARFSYAIPLEVIYMSPLYKWNPYNLPIWDREISRADNRKGGFKPSNAFNGSSERGHFFLTPEEFYDSTSKGKDDPADTNSYTVGVLDSRGVVRKVFASGTRIFTREIPDVGRVRMRYPIMPVHGEGGSVWKELNAVKRMLTKGSENSTTAAIYLIEMRSSHHPQIGSHTHTFPMTGKEWEDLMNGDTLKVTTSIGNGHDHLLEVVMNRRRTGMKYISCDDRSECWDKHDNKLKVIERPSLELEF